MELDDFRDALIRKTVNEAEAFLEHGKLGLELNEAIDRFVENEGVLRIVSMMLRGDEAKAIRHALDEEMFSERYCERELERERSLAEESRADSKRMGE
jgi:hypothetical protein